MMMMKMPNPTRNIVQRPQLAVQIRWFRTNRLSLDLGADSGSGDSGSMKGAAGAGLLSEDEVEDDRRLSSSHMSWSKCKTLPDNLEYGEFSITHLIHKIFIF